MSLDATYKTDRQIAKSLPTVWDAFFSRHGRLTDVQRQSIPAILDGRNVVLSSATASGKTEAACAPLVQRNLARYTGEWTILYVSPTRALVNDLYARLDSPLTQLGLRLIRRTGDHPARMDHYPHVLITTPESFDSLLCRGLFEDRSGHVLARVSALVLDEIHLLHGTPRGEMLRWLVERLRRLRSYAGSQGWSRDELLQVVALSATLADPSAIVDQYLRSGEVIDVPAARGIEVVGQGGSTEQSLQQYLASLTVPEKILVFCNSRKRADVLGETMAEALAQAYYASAVHHGSLAKRLREDAEELFHREKRVCIFATSTLELGIDIGDIDLVVLDGPPPDVSSLLQRIGRGNRRTDKTRVMLCSADAREEFLLRALLSAAEQRILATPHRGPHLSVALQQVASYVFQAPDRWRPEAKLHSFLGTCADEVLRDSLVPHMVETGELRRRDLDLILGPFWTERASTGAMHSVIESTAGATLISENDGSAIAQDINYRGGSRLQVSGKAFEVKGVESGGRVVIAKGGNAKRDDAQWNYVSSPRARLRQSVSEVRLYLGFREDEWPLYRGRWLFHFGGVARKQVLQILLPDDLKVESATEFYICFAAPCSLPLRWMHSATRATIESEIPGKLESLEQDLGLPYASGRLPMGARIEQVAGWLNIDNELAILQAAKIVEQLDARQSAALALLI